MAATTTVRLADNCIGSYSVAMDAGTGVALNATLLSGVPTTNSPLYTFLSAEYASAAAMETAFRGYGGKIVVRQLSGTATATPLVAFTADNDDHVDLTITSAANAVWSITLVIPHSLVK